MWIFSLLNAIGIHSQCTLINFERQTPTFYAAAAAAALYIYEFVECIVHMNTKQANSKDGIFCSILHQTWSNNDDVLFCAIYLFHQSFSFIQEYLHFSALLASKWKNPFSVQSIDVIASTATVRDRDEIWLNNFQIRCLLDIFAFCLLSYYEFHLEQRPSESQHPMAIHFLIQRE